MISVITKISSQNEFYLNEDEIKYIFGYSIELTELIWTLDILLEYIFQIHKWDKKYECKDTPWGFMVICDDRIIRFLKKKVDVVYSYLYTQLMKSIKNYQENMFIKTTEIFPSDISKLVNLYI